MDVTELVRVIPRTRFASDLVTLVCDGTPGARTKAIAGSGRVRVRYAGGGKSADDLIAAMVDRSSAPRRLTVVSSDRAVQRSARRRRSTVLTSEDFLRRIADDLHGEHLDAITAAEDDAAAAKARAVPKRPSRPTPKAEPLFPVDLIREAAAFTLPPECEPAVENDGDGSAAAENATGTAPASPTAPPPTPVELPASAAPATPARPAAEPLFSADLLAEALDLARDDQSQRSEDAARRRSDADARTAGATRNHAEQARIAAEQAGRDAEARGRRDARDRALADAASSAIGAADLQAIEDLVSRTIAPENRPKKDETFDADIVAEAERMLREFGDEPRGR